MLNIDDGSDDDDYDSDSFLSIYLSSTIYLSTYLSIVCT